MLYPVFVYVQYLLYKNKYDKKNGFLEMLLLCSCTFEFFRQFSTMVIFFPKSEIENSIFFAVISVW